MSGLFGKFKAQPTPPPPAPRISDADVMIKADQSAEALRRRRGIAANTLTQRSVLGSTGTGTNGNETRLTSVLGVGR